MYYSKNVNKKAIKSYGLAEDLLVSKALEIYLPLTIKTA